MTMVRGLYKHQRGDFYYLVTEFPFWTDVGQPPFTTVAVYYRAMYGDFRDYARLQENFGGGNVGERPRYTLIARYDEDIPSEVLATVLEDLRSHLGLNELPSGLTRLTQPQHLAKFFADCPVAI